MLNQFVYLWVSTPADGPSAAEESGIWPLININHLPHKVLVSIHDVNFALNILSAWLLIAEHVLANDDWIDSGELLRRPTESLFKL